jgi:hypothetical protein
MVRLVAEASDIFRLSHCIEKALEMGHLSVCRGSARGTWRGVSFLGTLRVT